LQRRRVTLRRERGLSLQVLVDAVLDRARELRHRSDELSLGLAAIYFSPAPPRLLLSLHPMVGLQSCLSLIVAQFAIPLPLTDVLTEEVDAEIAGNKQNNDDHTDDGEDAHAALISLQSGELRVSSRVHSSRCYPTCPLDLGEAIGRTTRR
jgi:hypothetical protein